MQCICNELKMSFYRYFIGSLKFLIQTLSSNTTSETEVDRFDIFKRFINGSYNPYTYAHTHAYTHTRAHTHAHAHTRTHARTHIFKSFCL